MPTYNVPVERRNLPSTVKLLIGAHAYACITKDGVKTDILLSPGRSASQSLRESADEYLIKAQRALRMAALCEEAAAILETAGPSHNRQVT